MFTRKEEIDIYEILKNIYIINEKKHEKAKEKKISQILNFPVVTPPQSPFLPW